MVILAVMVRKPLTLPPTILSSKTQDYLGGKGPGIVGALFLFIFNSFFAVGWLGMTWLYPAEIVPLRIRAPANALATSANWVSFNLCLNRKSYVNHSRHSTSWS